MSATSRSILAVGFLLALLGFTPGASAQTQGSSDAPATTAPPNATTTSVTSPADAERALFEQGTADLHAGHAAEAAEKLRRLWAKKKAYDVAGSLGNALHLLGKHAEAARLLGFALAHFPLSGSADERKGAQESFAVARREVVLVQIHVGEAGARIRLNGETIGTSPIAEDAYVEPGMIVVEATKDGFEGARVELRGDKGGTVDANVTMKAKSDAAPRRSWTLPTLAFGAAGASLVVGAIAGGASAAKLQDLKAACGSDDACPPAYRSEGASGRALGGMSTGAFIVAGFGAAAGVTLLLVPLGQPATAYARLTMGPGYLGVRGTF